VSQKVTITSAAVKVKTGTGKRSGQPYEMREQEAYIDTGHAFPDRFVLTLERDQQPHPPGEYTIAEGFSVGEYGRLEVSRHMRLIPIPRAAPAATKAG
jgi:hypothetical protein